MQLKESLGEGALAVVDEEADEIMRSLRIGSRCGDGEHDKVVRAVRHNLRMSRMISHAIRNVGFKAACGAMVGATLIQVLTLIVYALYLGKLPAGSTPPSIPGGLVQSAQGSSSRSTP